METIQITRKVLRKNKHTSGRGRSKKSKIQERANRQHTNDFLRQSFKPVIATPRLDNSVCSEVEKRFADSIKNLGALYGFTPNLSVSKKYPYSITELFENACAEMNKRSGNVEVVIAQEGTEFPAIATVKELSIGLTLYYMPLDALWILHKQKKKAAFNLLLSIYAYLHHISGMPLLNKNNYIESTYEMMRQSYEDSEGECEPEVIQEVVYDFRLMERASPILNKEIGNTGNLYDFRARIKGFKVKGNFEKSLLAVAKRFNALWKEFPDTAFAQNNAAQFLYPDEEDTIYKEQYFSFCWGFDGWMMDQLLEWVNCDLQEKSVFELPFSIQVFDREHARITHEFNYQNRLLALLDDLSDTLKTLYE